MKGTVVIMSRKEEGLLRKKTVYSGYLYGAPGASGKSTNRSLKRIYHTGEQVQAEYTVTRDKDSDEHIIFTILEDEVIDSDGHIMEKASKS